MKNSALCRPLQGLFLTLLLALLSSHVFAQEAPLTEREALQAQVLAGVCASCHGTEGRLSGVIPAIAQRPASVLESQLLAFKRGETPHTTVMERLARGYTDEELALLARYFAQPQAYRPTQP